MPAKAYSNLMMHAFTGKVNFEGGKINAVLLNNTYPVNQDTHKFFSDVASYELASGNGYTQGGKALTSVTLTLDAATNTVIVDAADTEWANSTFSARYAVLVDMTASTNATRPLIGYVDFGSDKGGDGVPFIVQWHETGIVRGTAA